MCTFLGKTTIKKALSAAAKAAGINLGKDEILQILGKFLAAGITRVPRKRLMEFCTTYKGSTGAGFDKNIGQLVKSGHVKTHINDQTVELIKLGIEYINITLLTTNKEKHDAIKEFLSRTGKLIFDKLVDRQPHDKLVIAEQIGKDLKKLSGYEKVLSFMKKMGWLIKYDNGSIKLTNKCFIN